MSEKQSTPPTLDDQQGSDDASTENPGAGTVRLRRRKDEAPEGDLSALSSANLPGSATSPSADADARDEEGGPASEAEAGQLRRRVFEPTTDDAASQQPRRRDRASNKPKGPGKPRAAAEDEDFAAMLAAENPIERLELEPGTMVQGTIIQMGREVAFIDLGSKAEAFIDVQDLCDESGELAFAQGDAIQARVVRFEKGGGIRLARRMSGRGDAAIAEAYAAGLPVEGKVTGVNKGGYEVQVFGSRAFCPFSQIDMAFTQDPEVHVGLTYTFRIAEYSEGGKRLVVSRAALLRERAGERIDELRVILEHGGVVEGTIRSMRDFGAFVDLDGIEGLVHVSELSHSRVGQPSDVVEVGQRVKVKILKIETSDKGPRIGLSIKQAESDPWGDVSNAIRVGDRLTGTVVRLAPFGAFVEIQPGIEGLIHVSEMSWEKHVRHPNEILSEGESVEVSVLSVDGDARRIGLSLKAAIGDPWNGAAERFVLGSSTKGVVERVASFGVFVKLDTGIVGLLPRSEALLNQGQMLERTFAPGTELEANVIAVDEERRRLTLSQRSAEPEREEPRRERSSKAPARPQRQVAERGQTYKEAAGNFATLGDLLAKQLADRKRGN